MDQTLKTVVEKGFSRRGFLAGAGAASAATLIGCGNSSPVTSVVPTTPTAAAITDNDVLNFALNLEYLEAEFYLRAVTGSGVPAADGGGATITVSGNSVVNFTDPFIKAIAVEQAQTELTHVRTLRAAITANGGTPVSQPALNFTDAFNSIAANAGIGSSFNPFSSELNYLIGALTFPDVGVTAYTGGASLLQSKTILAAAAGFQATEAYHAGMFRNVLAYQSLAAKDTTYLNYFNEVVQLRSKLGGGMETVLSPGAVTTASGKTTFASVTPSTIVAADSNALGYARTTDQVLHIVYGTMPGTYTASGGFYPSGMNGTIKQPTT